SWLIEVPLKTGQAVPFRVTSGTRGCPPMPARSHFAFDQIVSDCAVALRDGDRTVAKDRPKGSKRTTGLAPLRPCATVSSLDQVARDVDPQHVGVLLSA